MQRPSTALFDAALLDSASRSIVLRRTLSSLLVIFAATLSSVPAPVQGATDTSTSGAPQAAALPTGFIERIADVNGVKINYKIGGHGPVVILLHGYAETSHMWVPLLPLLAKTRTVIAPDLRGAGDSERPPGGYDKKTLAVDIRELVHQLGYEQQVEVVGHDIGLMVAYAYAAQYLPR